MKNSIWFVSVSLAFGLGCSDLGVVHDNGDPGSDLAPPSTRVSQGQQVLYMFQDGIGDRVSDVSDGQPVDLFIGDVGNVAWLPGGGVQINTPTVITTAQRPNEMLAACQAANAISIEMWHQPASVVQEQARMLTFSQDNNQRNFSLIQGQVKYEARLRTTGTNENGTPAVESGDNSLSGQVEHVVYTRTPINSRFYVDGQVVNEGVVGGDFSNWDLNYELAIGNELNGERPYLGSIFLAAVYCRELSPDEVRVNFQAGF